MATDSSTSLGDGTRFGLLWVANLLGPVATLAGLEIAYIFADRACKTGDVLPVHLTWLVCLLVALFAGWLGWREWRRWGGGHAGEEGGPAARSRFLAVTGHACQRFSRTGDRRPVVGHPLLPSLPMIGLALVHEGAPLAPHDLWSAWSLDPAVLAGLGITGLLYGRGMARLRARRGRRQAARRLEAVAFWAGWSALAIALVSPLHPMGEALLSAHMAQHELIMVARRSAPGARSAARGDALGLAAAAGGARSAAGKRRFARCGAVSRGWRSPGCCTPVRSSAGTCRGLYQRTIDSDLIHALQHSQLPADGAALLVVGAAGGAVLRGRHGAAILSLFATMVYTGGLGALLTLGRAVWYPAYGEAAPLWGLTPLEDQQLAGLIMWVPGGLSYLLATAWLVIDWLRVSEVRAVQIERARSGAAAAA